ncbi:hypothetical protein PR003_g18174, partial [Phytophthora rubi]
MSFGGERRQNKSAEGGHECAELGPAGLQGHQAAGRGRAVQEHARGLPQRRPQRRLGFKVTGLGPSYDSPKAKGDEAKPISPDDKLTEVAFAVVTWKLRRPTRSWPTPCRPYWTTTRR